MGQVLKIWARRLRSGRIPRLGQATACVAVLVLGWMLFAPALQQADDSRAVPQQPELSLAYHIGEIEPFWRSGKWLTHADVAWTDVDDAAEELHLGFRQAPVWLRLRLTNPTLRFFDGVLVYKFPYIDHLRYQGVGEDGDKVVYRAGDSVPTDPALPKSHFPSFPLQLSPGETQTVMLRVESTSLILAPLRLYEQTAFASVNLRDQLLFAALFGAVLAVCMYVVTVYLTVRDKAFLDFIVFSLTYAFYVAVASGMGQTWIWPHAWANANDLFFVVQGLLFASGVRFFQRYLGTARRAPRINQVMRVLIAVGLLTSLTPVLPPIVGKLTIAFVAGPGAIFVLGLSLFLAVRGMHRARVVAIGWGFSQITSVFIYLRIFDVTPYLPVNHYLTAIGCAIATLFFAIALALGLRRQQEQLLLAEKLNETRSSFMAGMSHELRTPLNAIMGFSEMMKEQMLGPIQPPVYQDYANDIHASSRNMLALVDNVLDISRIEGGLFSINPEPQKLKHLLDELVTMLEEKAIEAQVSLRIGDIDPEAEADLDHDVILRVLDNLTVNAIKFSEAGGEVTVSANVSDRSIAFAIRDRGAGMNPDQIDKLLIPFEMVRASAYTAKSGAGLGLPLSNALVKQHGGEMTFDTAPGQGTMVTVVLPRAA
ncbi:7TM diverse intracellular signaling domain-containing protein [Minwuia sp.]|uniref:sensor histidine kinase n=1 Tax=Minwuia sp. TaxID=2493630 RepID=UPI003A935A09